MRLKFVSTFAVWTLAFAQTAWADNDQIALGRARATEFCSACHQVTKDQPRPAPVPYPEENADVVTPSFLAISMKYQGHEAELRSFIKAPAHPMKEQEFLKQDLDAIVAYIGSARTRW